MGGDKPPILPLFDVFARTDGIRAVENFGLWPANYFQICENYANDALRRKSRMEQKEVRNVDYRNEEMALHSEASFSPNWPEIIWFFCNEFNTDGRGATTLCDGIKLWDNLSYEAKNFFLLNPIKYKLRIIKYIFIRNYIIKNNFIIN